MGGDAYGERRYYVTRSRLLSGHRVPTFSVFVAFIASFLLIGSAQAEVKVLTSIKPLQLIATAVQDGVAIPEVLLPPGASPHNYALRPSDVRKVQSVDLLYWIGPDMEGFLPRVLNGRTLPSVAVQDLPGMKLRRFAEDSHSHAEDADEHDHDHRPAAWTRICGYRRSTPVSSRRKWRLTSVPPIPPTRRAIRAISRRSMNVSMRWICA
jgi:ABC-type Zn uptake system ZnuABC Zn-binding protein ZnuA